MSGNSPITRRRAIKMGSMAAAGTTQIQSVSGTTGLVGSQVTYRLDREHTASGETITDSRELNVDIVGRAGRTVTLETEASLPDGTTEFTETYEVSIDTLVQPTDPEALDVRTGRGLVQRVSYADSTDDQQWSVTVELVEADGFGNVARGPLWFLPTLVGLFGGIAV
ncbi:MAG: hypothetical protein ABEI99_13170 [Halobaculum sp.]